MEDLPIEQEHPPQRWPIAKELLRLTWPIALSMLSYSLMTAVDTLFVGRFGAEAISSVGFGGLVSFTLLTFAMGLSRGGKVIVAHAMGAGKTQEIRALAGASLGVASMASVVTWVATLAVVPCLGHVFAESTANQYLREYVIVRSVGIPMFLLASALRELSQGVGDSRGPMWAALASNLLNIPLNALFVIGLGGKVTGSAWANVVAQCIDFAILAYLRRDWLLALRGTSLRLVRKVASTGAPLGLEMFLDVSAFSLLGFILARLGAVEMAAHQIALQISHLAILPILAMGESVSVLSGNAVGAKRFERLPHILRAGLGLGLLYAVSLSLVLLTIPEQVVRAFTSAQPVVTLASILLSIVAGFQLGFVFYGIGRAALRGIGDMRFTAKVTVGAAWICTPPLGYFFGHVLGFGVVGGWCALALEITLASTLYFIRLERRAYASGATVLDGLGMGFPENRTFGDQSTESSENWTLGRGKVVDVRQT
ncbi:MAG: MATE family efflux transporter [Polyangiaceae bacterium]